MHHVRRYFSQQATCLCVVKATNENKDTIAQLVLNRIYKVVADIRRSSGRSRYEYQRKAVAAEKHALGVNGDWAK